MRAAAEFVDRISAALSRLALWGAVIAVLVMAFSAGYQVVARYIFDSPPVWTEEVARRAMVWAGMLGASVAFRDRSDPTLFPRAAARTDGLGSLYLLVRATGVTIFAFPVIYYSLFGPGMSLARGFLGRNLERSAEMLNVSMIWFVAVVPIAFVLIMIHVAASLLAHFAGVRRKLETEQTETEDIAV